MVVVYIEREDLYVANLGDSEAIMCERNDQGALETVLISKKHKPGTNIFLPSFLYPLFFLLD